MANGQIEPQSTVWKRRVNNKLCSTLSFISRFLKRFVPELFPLNHQISLSGILSDILNEVLSAFFFPIPSTIPSSFPKRIPIEIFPGTHPRYLGTSAQIPSKYAPEISAEIPPRILKEKSGFFLSAGYYP